jgi:hypothetical protein
MGLRRVSCGAQFLYIVLINVKWNYLLGFLKTVSNTKPSFGAHQASYPIGSWGKEGVGVKLTIHLHPVQW